MKNALKMLKQVKLNSLYCWSITCGGDHAVVKDFSLHFEVHFEVAHQAKCFCVLNDGCIKPPGNPLHNHCCTAWHSLLHGELHYWQHRLLR